MNNAAAAPPGWSRRRWTAVFLLIFGLQLGLIFWLGERGNQPRPPAQTGFSYRMAQSTNAEWLSLNDPTLFALPHREGFSGQAWLETPNLPTPLYDWNEPTNWLGLAAASPGAALGRFLFEHPTPFVPPPADTAPDLALPRLWSAAGFPTASVLVLEGDAADRRLLTPSPLPSWTNSELLEETRVQAMVNHRGMVISTALLASSGHAAADQFALDQARTARFAADSAEATGQAKASPLQGLSWVQFRFQWHTAAAGTTTNAAGSP